MGSKMEPNQEKPASSENSLILDIPDLPCYAGGAQYWEKVEPTVDGMLGGLGNLDRIDIQASERFLKTIFKRVGAPGTTYALDCGSGIGRITKNLLIRFFDKVDLVDQDQKFIDQATKNFEGNEKIGLLTCCGLQKYNPEVGKYDVIWVQWVLLYMTDDDLISFLLRCKAALRPNGMIIAKENTTRTNVLDDDPSDSSATRSFSMFMGLFNRAGFTVTNHVKQKGFPKELYPVWTFALKPKPV